MPEKKDQQQIPLSLDAFIHPQPEQRYLDIYEITINEKKYFVPTNELHQYIRLQSAGAKKIIINLNIQNHEIQTYNTEEE